MPGPPVTGSQSTGGQGVPLTSHPVYTPPTHGLGNGRAGVSMPQMIPGPPPVSGTQHAGGPQGGPHANANVHYQTVQGPTNSRTGVPMSQVMTGPPVSGPQPGGGQGGPISSGHYQTVQGPGSNRAGVAMVPQQSMRPHTPSSSSGNTMHQAMHVFPHFQPHSAPYFVNNTPVNFVPSASGGSNPMLTIPGAAVQSISYTHPQHGHVRMPFQSHHGQHPIYNYSGYHYPVMMQTPGQAPQQVMPTSQNQQPGPPRGGQPMPSQSPANVSGTMMSPMSVEQQETRKVPQVPPPSQPLKKRERRAALVQDPNTLEVVELEKLAQSDAPTSKSSTSGSGTSLNVDTTTSGASSVTPVTTALSSSTPKAETTIAESSDKNKNLNNTADHHVQVEFIEISKAASSDSKAQSDARKTTETSVAVSKTESSNRFEIGMQDKKSPESKVPETQKDLAQKQEPSPVKDNSTTTMIATDDKASAAVNKDSSLSSKNLPSPKVTSPSSSTSKILVNNTSPKLSSTKITSTVPAAEDSAQQKALKQTTSTDVSKTKLVVQAPADSTKVNGEVSEPLPSTPKTVEEVKRVADDKDSSDTTPSSPPSSTSMPSISTAAEDTSVYLKDGRYVYTREELLRFEKAPASHVKPNIDKKIDEVIRAGKKVSLVSIDPFMPPYVARSGPSRPGMRPSIGQYTGRSSQDTRQQPRKIIPTPSLSQDVKLHTTENAWKPEVGGQKKAISTEESEQLKTKELEKRFRGYLNKITPQKYDVIQDKLQELKIDTEDRLVRVLNLVFDKAVDEPSFCLQYANLCKYLSSLSLTKLEDGKETKVEFWRLLIMRCQQEFEKDIYEGIDVEGKLAAINDEQEAEKKKILNAELDDEKHRARKRSLGIMKLIGELYRLNMLKGFIMVNCINRLISDPTEDENLECLCMFLRTVGQKLEGELAMRKEEHMKKFNEHFLTLQTIVNEKKVSSRVRFLIQDIIDMRNKNWQERSIHKDNKPKTIDQIHEEAARQEERNQQEHLQHLAMRNERRRREGELAPQSRRSQQGQTQQELSKIQQILDGMRNLQSSGQVDSNISLGGAQNLSKWSSGSKTQIQAAAPLTGRPEGQLGPQGGRYGVNSSSSISQSSRATPSYGDMAKSRSQGAPAGSSRVTSLHIQSQGPPKSSTPPFGPRNEIGGPDRSRHASLDKRGGGRGSMPSSRSGSQRVDSPAHSQSRERPRKAEQEEELTEGKAENRVKWVLDEGLQNNPAHVVGLVRDYFDEKTIHWFLQFGLNQTLEASPDKRHLFGDVCAQLLKQADVNFDVFLNEFKELMSMSVDLVVDIPLFWIYLGEIIGRIIPELSLDERKTILSVALNQDKKTKGADDLIASTFQTIARRSNEGLAYDIWHNSNITWNEFLSVNVEEFSKERQLEFLLSSMAPPLPVNSSDFTATIERLLKGSDPVRSISEFVKDKVSDRSSETISALTTAIIRGSLNLDTREDNREKLLKKELLGELCRIVLSKVVALNETLEFEVLYSMQELMEDLKHPQQLSGLLINELVEGDVVSAGTVFQWVDSPSKERIKGLAMTVAQAKRVIDYLREECGGEEAKNEN